MTSIRAVAWCIVAAGCAASEPQPLPHVSPAAATLDGALAQSASAAAEARRLLHGPHVDYSGSPSPDGRMMSFVDWSQLTLNVHDFTTGESRLVARAKPGRTEFPEYSRFAPDGRQIAVSWFDGDGYELRLVSVDGTSIRVVVPRDAELRFVTPLHFTPDGRQILVMLWHTDGSSSLALVDVATGARRVLRTFSWDTRMDGSAAVSPDQRYIAFGNGATSSDKAQSIVVAALDGSRQTRVIDGPGRQAVIGWAADGRLFYTSEQDSQVRALAVRMKDGRPAGTPELLKADFSRARPMGISSDGRFFYGESTGTYDVYIASVDVANARVLAPAVRATSRPIDGGIDWTPDGRQVAYLIRRSTRLPPLLGFRDEQTGEVRELEPDLGYMNGAIRWAPDRQSLVSVVADKRGTYAIRQVDARTGAATTLVEFDPSGGMARRPSFTPDGKWLYYTLWNRGTGKGFELVRRDMTSGRQETVLTSPEPSGNWALSYDGRTAAVIFGGPGGFFGRTEPEVISALSLDSGELRELVRIPDGHALSALEWSRDGRYLLYAITDNLVQGTATVWRVPAEGGEPRSLDLTLPSLQLLRTHPDGQRLAYAGGDTYSEVWVLESGARTRSARR